MKLTSYAKKDYLVKIKYILSLLQCSARPSIESLLASPQVCRHTASSSKASSVSGSNSSDQLKSLADILERERKCLQAEVKLQEKEAFLKEKELRLEKLEKELSKRLADIEGEWYNVVNQSMLMRIIFSLQHL